ncbi:MAG: radical SAM protein, partial [Gemmatimonadetes bacterium]|nr:radical SAM protein [Gemmatimonadota bacterium]
MIPGRPRRELPVLNGMAARVEATAGFAAAPPPRRRVPASDTPRIALVTLGCDKNTVDSERMLAWLAGAGARVAEDAAAADVVVVNTCGFIAAAKEESVDAILDALRLKETGRVRAVVAVGCMVQRYRDQLVRELPEVDLFLGLTDAHRLLPELRRRGLLPEAPVPAMERPMRLLSTRTHTSHLKVSEGCDHGCAFCAIPLMRGKHRSVPLEQLVREAQELEARGVVELNLISQDTTWYGRDLVRRGDAAIERRADAATRRGGDGFFVGKLFSGMVGTATATATARGRGGYPSPHPSPSPSPIPTPPHGLLPDLLQALLRETSIPWFRLFYMYPSGIQRALVELVAREPRILPYLDMPIQHGSDRMLERMRRPERRATIRERVRWLREAIPDLALRTTVMVGFP